MPSFLSSCSATTSIQDEVDRLVTASEEVYAESELRSLLTEGLARLRQRYRHDAHIFERHQIETLARLRDAIGALDDLMDLTADVAEAANMVDYHQLTAALHELDALLNGMAVAARVRRELRLLEEKRPQLEHASQVMDQDRRLSREHELKRLSPLSFKCPAGHDLTLRSGRHGDFLGCVRYPECQHTRGLPSGRHAP